MLLDLIISVFYIYLQTQGHCWSSQLTHPLLDHLLGLLMTSMCCPILTFCSYLQQFSINLSSISSVNAEDANLFVVAGPDGLKFWDIRYMILSLCLVDNCIEIK
jgi:hypothetical protein